MEFKLEIIHNFFPLDCSRILRLKFWSSLVGNYYVKICKTIFICYLWCLHVYVSPHVCVCTRGGQKTTLGVSSPSTSLRQEFYCFCLSEFWARWPSSFLLILLPLPPISLEKCGDYRRMLSHVTFVGTTDWSHIVRLVLSLLTNPVNMFNYENHQQSK